MHGKRNNLVQSLKGFYHGKKILVPGGAGFIGSRLSMGLANLGADITVVDPYARHCGGNPFNLRPCRGSINVVRKGIEAFTKDAGLESFSCIFNCSGLTDHHLGLLRPDIDYRINCESGLVLLQGLAKTRSTARLVSIGSRGQYGKVAASADEAGPLQPLDIQAVHKTALEHYHSVYANAFGLDFIYFRLTNTYGPGQRMRGKGIGFVGEIVRDSLDGREVVVYGSLDRVKDIVYVDDVVEALLYAGMTEKSPNPVFNLGGRPLKVGELIECIRKKVPGITVKVRPFPENIKTMDSGDAVLKWDKFAAATGWSPRTPLEQGISLTIDYYRAHKKDYW